MQLPKLLMTFIAELLLVRNNLMKDDKDKNAFNNNAFVMQLSSQIKNTLTELPQHSKILFKRVQFT
jgi:hypothetical protein